MISARFFYAGQIITGCTISGHAGYAEAGADIVCAAVSSAVQTVANLMEEIYGIPVESDISEETGDITLRLVEMADAADDSQKLFRGLLLQLQLLKGDFPAHIQTEQISV